MRAAVVLLVVSMTAPLMAGCAECEPQDVDASVVLSLVDEEVRALPILSSGGGVLAVPGASVGASIEGPAGVGTSGGASTSGVRAAPDLPDSHGWLDVNVTIEGPPATVDVVGLSLDVRVRDGSVPVVVTNVQGGHRWDTTDEGRTWDGVASNGTTLRLWWTVDVERANGPDAIVLPEGAAYVVTVEFDWHHRSCAWRAEGRVSQDFTDFVQPAANSGNFESTGNPTFEADGDSVGFTANLRSTSGLDVVVTNANAWGLVVGGGPAGTIALATFPSTGWRVANEDRSDVAPQEVLTVLSTDPATARAEYAVSGAVAPPGGLADARFVVLAVEVTYEVDDPTIGITTERFGFVIRQ